MLDFDREIDGLHADLIALCGDLVSADSINPPGATAEMARRVSNWLGERGVPAEIVRRDDQAPNVVSRIACGRPGRHVVFNAHMDTMPPGDEALWSVPPLALTRRDGRAYGLGMGNMKGALAGMCLVAWLVHRHAPALAGTLSLTAVSDEVMFGDRGTIYLLQQMPELAGDFLISGEGPGYMDLAVAEKGLLWLDIDVTGAGGHSSNALAGKTAAIVLARFLAAVDLLNDRYARVPPELPGVSGGDGNLGFRLSVNVGALRGGGVRSQIATLASAELDIRLPPGIGTTEVEDAIRQCAPDGSGIVLRRVKGWDANWTDVESPLVQAATSAIIAVRGAAPRNVVRLPGSDARQWRDRGVPAICYGPQPTLSSGVDDHAAEQDLLDCTKVYARTALALMASSPQQDSFVENPRRRC